MKYAMQALFIAGAPRFVAGYRLDSLFGLGPLDSARLFDSVAELLAFVSQWMGPAKAAPHGQFVPASPEWPLSGHRCGPYQIVEVQEVPGGIELVPEGALHQGLRVLELTRPGNLRCYVYVEARSGGVSGVRDLALARVFNSAEDVITFLTRDPLALSAAFYNTGWTITPRYVTRTTPRREVVRVVE